MKEVIAIVRMNMMNQTKRALTEAGINGYYACEVQGRGVGLANPHVLAGAAKGYEEAAALLGETGKLYPKRLLDIVVPDKDVAGIVRIIIGANKTGKPGDGKIFVLPMNDAVRVRTAESGDKSII